MRIKRRIGEGEVIPRGYGVAWYEPALFYRICYPIPINLVIHAVREAHWQIIRRLKRPFGMRERWLRQVFRKGYALGYTEGRAAGERHADNLLRELKAQIQGEPRADAEP